MALDQKIREQYKKRGPDTGLYNSVYSKLVEREKWGRTKSLLEPYIGKNKTLLEIGAGRGLNSVEFEKLGYKRENLFLNELLEERIKIIKEKFPDIALYEGNALQIDFGRKFDCVFQSTVFTSILSDSDRKALAEKMWDLLKPGGIILWYDFIYNNPRNPDVKKVSITEVKQLFPEAVQSQIHKVTLAPPVGRRVGKFYPLFNIPPLRSHILAVFQKQ
jgi:SAM-dependent methyltransferase